MKRSPIKRIGKKGRANIAARKKIAEISEEFNLTECEIDLPGCTKTFGLAPAHKHKRAWYGDSVEKLSDYNEWVAACQHCHSLIEHDKDLTEETFKSLRG